MNIQIHDRLRMRRAKPLSRLKFQENLWAYAFLAPALLGFTVFVAGPIIASLVLTVFSWDLLTPARFVGIENFQRLAMDKRVLTAYGVTATFVVSQVTLTATIGMILALGVHHISMVRLRYLFRTVFFFPVITSTASVAIVWTYLYNTDRGVINYYMTQIGLSPIAWLSSSASAIWAIIIMSVWKSLGFDFILFEAGLKNIPQHLYEAARIDGAGSWKQFWYITLPMLTPTLLFSIVMGLIGAFQVFDAPYIMTTGGPGDATRTIVMHIYENGFRFLRVGYASTISLTLFGIILSITIAQLALSKRWVFYQ